MENVKIESIDGMISVEAETANDVLLTSGIVFAKACTLLGMTIEEVIEYITVALSRVDALEVTSQVEGAEDTSNE